MSRFSKIFLTALLLAGSVPILAQTITQTGTFGPAPTDVLQGATAATFNYFQSAGAPSGAVLDSVSISVSFTETVSALSIQNTAGTQQSFTYQTSAHFSIGGTVPDRAALRAGLPAGQGGNGNVNLYTIGDSLTSQYQTIQAGQTLVYLPTPVSAGVTPALIGLNSALNGNGNGGTSDINPFTFTETIAGTTASYAGAGTFTISYGTGTAQTFTGAGGNTTDIQTTTTQGSYTVVYNYHLTNPILSIVKTASNGGVFTQGSTASFNLVVSNLTGAPATTGTVTVTDTIPAGLTPTSASGTGWGTCTIVGQNVSCPNTNALAGGSSYNPITVNVSVASNAASNSNTGTVNCACDPSSPHNSTVPYTVNPPPPVLSIVKTASNGGVFIQGGTASFNLVVSNQAGTSATSGTVTVTDTLPAGLTPTSASGTGWGTCTIVGQNVSCPNTNVLAAGSSYNPITVNVNVASNAASNSNTGTVNCACDPTSPHNSTVPYTVNPPPPVLSIVKTASNGGAFTPGGTASFNLVVSNQAGTSATSGTVTVTDTLPAGLTPTAASGTEWGICTIVGQLVTCPNTNVLAAGSSYNPITVNVNVASNATGNTNTGIVSCACDPTSPHHSTVPYTVNLPAPPPPPVLSIVKTASNGGVFMQGGTGSFNLVVSNQAGTAATSGAVTVTDTLPAGLTPTSASGPEWGTCTIAGQSVTCVNTTVVLAPGTSYPPITVNVNVAANATSNTNVATVSCACDPTSPHNGPAPYTVNPPAPMLSIVKTASNGGVFSQGGTASFSLVVSNQAGTAPTSGTVTVTDTIPAGLTPTSASGAGWGACTISGQTVTCPNSNVLAGGSSYPAITVNVNVAKTAASSTNVGVVSCACDPTSPHNGPAPYTVNPPPMLSIAKSASNGGVFTQGGTASFNLVVSNQTGTSPTSGTVTVTDTVPTGLTPTSASGPGWGSCSISGQSVTCSNTNVLAAGSSYPAIAVNVNVASNAASNTNIGTVSCACDPTSPHNGPAPYTVNPPPPVLSIIKTASNGGVFTQGGTASFSLLVSNQAGTAPTSGTVTVTDTLPTGLTPTSASGTGWGACTISGQTVTCPNTNVLAAGTSYPAITVNVNVASNATASTNTGVVSCACDPTSPHNGPAPYTVNGVPDMTITKTHAGTSFAPGGSVTFTLTANNIGTAPTTGTVTVTDTLPTGLTATAIGGPGWTCAAPPTLSCTRTDVLAAGASYPGIAVTAGIASSATGTLVNNALVGGGGEINTTNDTANDSIVVTGLPDLTIAKSHTGTFTRGAAGTYTIVASNVGGAPTVGTVTVTDTLPTGLTATAISGGPTWSCTLSPLSCTTTTVLAAGAAYPAITLTVNVAGNAPASVVNTAVVGGGGETNLTNDTANDPTTFSGNAPNLSLSKVASGSFIQGGTGIYTLIVTNTGAAPTSGMITTTDPLATGLTGTGISGAGWDCSMTTLSCTRSDALAPGASYPPITVSVLVGANAPSTIVNVATTGGGGSIPSTSSTAQAVVNVATISTALHFTKVSDRSSAQIGDVLAYTLTLTNQNATAYGGGQIQDVLPLGFNYLAGSGSIQSGTGAPQAITPVIAGSVLTFSFGTLAPQQVDTITYRVSVTSKARIGPNVNTAQATTTGTTQLSASNPAQATVTIDSGLFTLRQFLIGRVFVDTNGNGVFDKGERPVAGARIYLSNGQSATTDSKGLYNIPVVAPGSVVVEIDPATIPKGYTLSSGGRLDAESWSRLVRTPLLGGAMLRQNFALKPCPNCQAAPVAASAPATPAAAPVSSRPVARLQILPAQPSLPGDGRSNMSIRVQVLDDQGQPTSAKEVRIRTNAGQFMNEEGSKTQIVPPSAGTAKPSGMALFGAHTDPQQGMTTEQVPESMQAGMVRSVQGEASFLLIAANTTGAAHLIAETGDPEHLITASTDIYFTPEKRSPILATDGEISVGRAAPDVLIYGQNGTVQHHADAFLRTPLGDDALMTLAYTSHLTINDSNGNPGLFQLDPLDRVYPVFGDSSTQYQTAQANSHVYGRIDYGQSYLLYGDLRMGVPPMDAAPAPASQAFAPQPGAPQEITYGVGNYNRNVTGAAIHLEDSHHDSITLEGARPNTAFARDIFPGSTFGLIQLSHVDILPGSETGVVEVRDVHNPEILISTETLVRSVDYTIDPIAGGIFFLRSLNIYDQALNLVQVVFTYEYQSIGAASSVYGIRTDLRLRAIGLRLGLGLTDQRGPSAGSFFVGDINLRQTLPNGGRLNVEVPISHGSALAAGFTESAAGTMPNNANGTAIRADLDQPFHWLSGRFRASFSKTDTDFFNPFGATVIPGSLTGRGSVEVSPLRKTRFKFGFTDERNHTTLVNNQRQTGSFEWKQSLTETLTWTSGYDYRDFQDTFNNTQIISNELAAGLEWKPFSRFTASVRREQNLTESDPTYPNETLLSAKYQVSETVRLYMTERLSSAPIVPIGDLSTTGFTALSGKNQTSIGVEDKWSRYTSIQSSYMIENGLNGTDTFAVIGLVNRIPVENHLSLDLGLQRGQLISGKDGSFDSGSVGFSWTPKKNFRASTRYEVRSLGGLGQIVTAGAAGRIADGLTVLGRFQYSAAAFTPGTGAVDVLNPAAINSTLSQQTKADQGTAALAWRPWKTDREGILFAYTLRSSDLNGINTTVPQNDRVSLLSTDGYFQANRHLEFYGKFAMSDRTYDYVGAASVANTTWLWQARAQAKVSRRFDVAVEGRFIVQPDTSTEQSEVGAEVGFWVMKDLRAAGGYNFKSADLVAANFLTNPVKQGVYFALSTKLSNLFNVFNPNECTCTVAAPKPPPPPPPPPVQVQPITGARDVCSGDNVTLQSGASGGAPGSTFTYQWLVNGEPVPGATSTTFSLATLGTPGTKTITVRASAGNQSVTSAPVTVIVRPLLPPTIQFSVTPSTVAYGAPAIPLSATASGQNQCNGNLTVTYSGEAVTGASFNPAAVGGFNPANPAGVQTRTIPLTATVTDQHNQTASAVANVTITLKPVASRRDIVFPDRSARVNNAAKRYLIEELTPQLRNDPNSTVILIGHRDASETGRATANLDTERMLNAAAVLSAGTGVCPSLDLSRIQVSAAGTDQTSTPMPFGDASVKERTGQAVSATDQRAPFRRVEVWFIPSGADMPAIPGPQPAPVQAIQSRGCPR